MKRDILINHKIPSTMSLAGLEYLGKMARTVPENGVIVEIGPLFGSSTWVLAKNAKPSVTVYSIDTWEPAPWIDKIERRYRNCIPFSMDAFLEYTKDCPNVKAIQGWSPEIVSKWNRPIDMFFDDATHGDPGFSENLNFFLPFIRETGIICGDDYSGGWPDIVRVVDSLGSKWGKQPEVIGRVWSLTVSKQSPPEQVADKLEAETLPSVSVSTTSVEDQTYDLPPSAWSGALHKPSPLKRIKLTLNTEEDDLELAWGLRLSTGEITPLLSSGEVFTTTENQRIIGISVKLNGTNARKYRLEYQAGFCWGKGGGKRYPLSATVSQGKELASADPRVAINAIRLIIVNQKTHRRKQIQLRIDKIRYYNWRAILKNQ